jgi:dTDP-glucose pyrophosphorylase
VEPGRAIDQALALLDAAGTGVLVLVSPDGTLAGIVTDGDIRRQMLAGASLSRPLADIATRAPLVARPDVGHGDALDLMDRGRAFPVHHLPLVREDGAVVGLLLRSDLRAPPKLDISAVIMAGGFGTRMRPLTDDVPKPMLPVAGRPLLEVILGRLRDAGIRQVKVTTHYLPERITSHFGDGRDYGLDLSYLQEDRPLGTAGALRHLTDSKELVLVMNGDVLTGVDFHAMVAYHREHQALVTIGVHSHDVHVPYGVVECDAAQVRALREKPVCRFLINAGIYLLEPSVLTALPEQERFDMTDVIQQLLDRGERVVGFPIVESWIDIGQHADYERAQAAASTMRPAP